MADMPLVAVLAAGRGMRFGGDKLEADCAGKPLGRWVIEAVEGAGLAPGLIVTGPQGVSFAPEWRVLTNAHPETGLGPSLALAAHAALAEGAESLLIVLADMPLLAPEYLRRLAGVSAPAATLHPDGRPGVPALLDRKLMQRALSLDGDRGAGPLLAGATLLEAPTGTLSDVDRPDDLARAADQLAAR